MVNYNRLRAIQLLRAIIWLPSLVPRLIVLQVWQRVQKVGESLGALCRHKPQG